MTPRFEDEAFMAQVRVGKEYEHRVAEVSEREVVRRFD